MLLHKCGAPATPEEGPQVSFYCDACKEGDIPDTDLFVVDSLALLKESSDEV